MIYTVLPAFPSSPAWLRVVHTASYSGTQAVHVTIKQASAACSQTSFKCSVAEPLAWKREFALSGKPWNLAFQKKKFPAMAEP